MNEIEALMFEKLEAKVKELTTGLSIKEELLDSHIKHIATMQAKIEGLREDLHHMSRYAAARESKITPLQAKVEELEIANKMWNESNMRCGDENAVLVATIIELQAKVEEMFTKEEIRVVLTDAYIYAADPSAEVDMLIQEMVKNKAALKQETDN